MSSIQIVPTRSAAAVQDLVDPAFWRQLLTRSRPRTPMGGRIIALSAPLATLGALAWGVAWVMAPLLAVGVAAMV